MYIIHSGCNRPSSGCTASSDIYNSLDCDGDGELDHACSNTNNDNRWLVLSTEGCPNSWGTSRRAASECPTLWGTFFSLSKPIRISIAYF